MNDAPMPWLPISSPTGVLATLSGVVRILGAGFGNAIPQAANCVLGEVLFRVRVADRLVGAELSNIQQQRQSTAFLRRLPYVQ